MDCEKRTCINCVACSRAAGKSTFTQALSGHFQNRGWRSFILSYDEIIPEEAYELRKEENDAIADTQSSWKLYRQEVLQCLDEFLRSGHIPVRATGSSEGKWDTWARFARIVQDQRVSLTAGSHPYLSHGDTGPLIVLLDDNFYYRSMRYEVYQLARKFSVGFCQLYLQCPVKSCVTRNQGRNCPLPDDVIVEMATRIQPPNPDKNPWEQNSLTLASTDEFSQEDIEMVMTLFVAALDNPLSPVQDNTEQKEADRQRCASSIVHQADQACRRLVSQAMQKAREYKVAPGSMKFLAADLNQLKARFLNDLRKDALQGCSISPGETVNIDQVVNTAVAVFDREKEELIRKHSREDEAKPV
ncbi:hypothetical protein MATL_G00017000 [Megalops atlanticus]|uniref:Phosphoseryl-tRNA kinase n=1 Tax=Megalops atlanticus TaxID=7932 RepID=A0A9D3TEY6_MEGAT|nr:hypothetical protein MATL_G00017000 [Megalops atlanticus]